MNKIKYILVSLATLFLCNSCDELDLGPIDWYGSVNFWNNEAQVDGYMTGLHKNVRDRYDMFFRLGETRGGIHRSGTSSMNTSIDLSSPEKTNQFAYNRTGISGWFNLYGNIMQVNHFIQKVEEECSFLSTESRSYYLGQAYGLRALYYSMLNKTFGGVPIIKTVSVLDGQVSAESLYTARSTVEETLNFVKEDLKKSEDYFGSNLTHDPNKWSKYATSMLKADVYLWSAKVTIGDHTANAADAQIAKDALTPIVGKFALQKDYGSIFSTKRNGEIVYAIRFADQEATNFGANFVYSEVSFVNQVYDRNNNLFTTDVLNLKATGLLRHEYKFGLFKSYDDTDLRRDATFLDYTVQDASGNILDYGLSLKKLTGSINSNNNRIYDTDIIVYRYSDVLLMLAEAENKLGNYAGVKTYMDEVRQRAYGDNFDSSVAFTPGTFGENELAILHERDKEFVSEGKRWFDVVRFQDESGKSLVFSSKANYKHLDSDFDQPVLPETDAYMILWPIDVSTLNNDPLLKQTPGYEE